MPERKWKSPLLDWNAQNEDPNLAFTLIACNENARQMWADPHNSARYVPSSFNRDDPENRDLDENTSKLTVGRKDEGDPRARKQRHTEPGLRFRFNEWPKNSAKGYVLGSDHQICDALLGDPGSVINKQMLALSFNEHHQLVMNVTSDAITSVLFNDQKVAPRQRFSWIFPRGQDKIHVEVAHALEFNVVLPKYGLYDNAFHRNCESFLSSVAHGNSLAENDDITSEVSSAWEPFYLQEKHLGSGSYGDVVRVLRMPDGKTFAAKKFQHEISFRKEVDILKKVCQIPHENIVQFVEEWDGDHQPMLIMEYVAGGNLRQKLEKDMEIGEIMNLAHQMLSALGFLHDQDVMHRDIKPENILCGSAKQYKLADFGVSREATDFASKQGTDIYMAPEVLGLEPYDLLADMWSLGVLLFECMGCLPAVRRRPLNRHWCEGIAMDMEQNVREVQEDSDLKDCDSLKFVILVQEAMLQLDAEDRWSARRCLAHPTVWDDIDCGEDSDAGDGAKTPTQAHQNGSFAQSALEKPGDHEAKEAGSLTIRKNGGGTRAEEEAPQNVRNEDRPAVLSRDTVEEFSSGPLVSESLSESFGETVDPIVEGAPYDPEHVEPDPDFVSDHGADEPSVSDGNVKRKRGSQPSTIVNEEDVSGEVAAPGPEDGVDEAPPHPRANPAKHDAKRSKIHNTI